MNDNQILNEFKKQFGHLKKFGLQIHGISNLGSDQNVINISTPFIFDHRQIPKKYLGLDVRTSTLENTIPKEFQNIDSEEEYVWAYQRFEQYVENKYGSIIKTLGQRKMLREDMLDTICFGDFKRHKEMCLKWETNGKIPKWKK